MMFMQTEIKMWKMVLGLRFSPPAPRLRGQVISLRSITKSKMAGLKQIKSKIRSVGKTGKVTKAMEAVSAVKMRKGQQMAITARPYALAALHILRRTSGSSDAARHPLLRVRENVRRLAVLLITSDKGLAGALNSAVLKAVREELAALHLPKDHVDFYCIGRKGKDHFEKRDRKST